MYIDKDFDKAITVDSPHAVMRLTFLDGEQEIIEPENSLISATMDIVGNSLFGECLTWQLKAKFLYEEKKDYVGRKFKAEIGAYSADDIVYYIPMGVFYINDDGQTTDETNKEINIVAYDGIKILDKKYELIEIDSENGITGYELQKKIVERNGFTLDENNPKLTFDDYTFYKINVSENSDVFDREVLQDYYRLNMANAFIDRTGTKIQIKNVFTDDILEEEITFDYDSTDFKLEIERGPINSLVYANQATGSEESFQEIFAKDDESIEQNGLTEIRFSNNVFLDLLETDEQQNIINTIFPIVNNFKYVPINIDMFARPNFDPYDKLKIKNSENNVYQSPISIFSYNYNGGLIGVMKTPIIPETTADYEKGGIGRSVNQVRTEARIIVNQLDNKISLIVERVETNENQIDDLNSTVMILDNKIQLEVSERSMDYEQIKTDISSSITQLKDSVTIEFKRVDDDIISVGDSLEQLKTFYRFDSNGAVIGKSENPFSISISNKEIDFLENGNIIAYVNGQKMYIQSLEVITQAIIGNHMLERFEGDNVGTIVRQVSGEVGNNADMDGQ